MSCMGTVGGKRSLTAPIPDVVHIAVMHLNYKYRPKICAGVVNFVANSYCLP